MKFFYPNGDNVLKVKTSGFTLSPTATHCINILTYKKKRIHRQEKKKHSCTPKSQVHTAMASSLCDKLTNTTAV